MKDPGASEHEEVSRKCYEADIAGLSPPLNDQTEVEVGTTPCRIFTSSEDPSKPDFEGYIYKFTASPLQASPTSSALVVRFRVLYVHVVLRHLAYSRTR